MALKRYLIVEKGCVKAKTKENVVFRTYYSKGDAVRADWEDEEKGTVQVLLENGKILLISDSGVLLRSF